MFFPSPAVALAGRVVRRTVVGVKPLSTEEAGRLCVRIVYLSIIRCDGTHPRFPSTTPGFQSLSGFPLSCDDEHGKEYIYSLRTFQSLSGFPLSCDITVRACAVYQDLVSIPIGFSIELRLYTGRAANPAALMFQSLSGFPLSCDSSG